MLKYQNIIFVFSILLLSCSQNSSNNYISPGEQKINYKKYKSGLDVIMENHLDMLFNKNLAIVTNQTGKNIDGKSNVSLLMINDSTNLIKIFTPEHGFTGDIPAGKVIYDKVKSSNHPPIISLYGSTKKPTPEMLSNIDLILYDIQDVGARFYTYISTLGLVMEAAAEADIPIIVLDRPNPISTKVAGPILDIQNKSFVGMYPIPIQYGLTVGELANMIIGEKMIGTKPKLTVIPMENYDRSLFYDDLNLTWINPSPNISDLETAILYPGLCLIEATNISEGRGTLLPFKQIGAPWIDSNNLLNLLNQQNLPGVDFSPINFTPISIPAMSKYPKYEDIECYGITTQITDRYTFDSILTGITVLWAINKIYPDSIIINQKSIARLWGSENLYLQLKNGSTPLEIIESYQTELNKFKQNRKKYLIYE